MPVTRATAANAATAATAANTGTAGRQRNTARARAAQAEDRVAVNPAQGVRERGGRARTRNINRGNLRRSFSVPNLDEGEIYKLRQ